MWGLNRNMFLSIICIIGHFIVNKPLERKILCKFRLETWRERWNVWYSLCPTHSNCQIADILTRKNLFGKTSFISIKWNSFAWHILTIEAFGTQQYWLGSFLCFFKMTLKKCYFEQKIAQISECWNLPTFTAIFC